MNPSSCVLPGSESHWSRRSFLSAAAGTAIGMAGWKQLDAKSTGSTVALSRPAKQVIFLFLTGGPSQIDTWDPKPAASLDVRNFDPACATSIPGVSISENLPRMAQRLHQVSLVRSLHHAGPATHAAGQQLLMTGSCFLHNQTSPYFGSVIASSLRDQSGVPTNLILGGALENEYSTETSSQTCGGLPSAYSPRHVDGLSTDSFSPVCQAALDIDDESWSMQERYGFHDLGRMCLQARRLIERGTRVVTVNQFSSVFDRTTWDMHANGGRLNSTAADYRDTLCPQLDQALSGLLDDLSDRGLLSETIVAVCGEMGRSPRINCYGGRDHHTGVWTGLLAGGPIRSGLVVGASDANGETPVSRPVTPAAYVATILSALGIKSIADAEPVAELL